MPSSPGYKRNYAREAAIESPQRRKQRLERVRARRLLAKRLGKNIPTGYDVDHKKPLSKGGSNKITNLQLQKASANRSYRRTRRGAMASKYD